METIKIEFKAPAEAITLFAEEIAGYKTTVTTEKGVEEANPVTAITHSEEFVKQWLLRQLEKANKRKASRVAQAEAEAMKELISSAQ